MRRARLSIALSLLLAAAYLSPAAPVLAAPTPAATAHNTPVTQGLRLVMVDLQGCAFCAAWKREVMPDYATRPEGRAAPLALIPIGGPWPDGLALAGRPRVTPTFILLRDGMELARIEGYDSADSFWPALRRMLAGTTKGRTVP